METSMKQITILCLAAIVLIFSIASVYLPWWSIKTTRKAQIATNTTITVDYTLFQLVTAEDKAKNKSVAVSFADLQADPAEKDSLSSFFNISLILLIGGIVLTALTVVCTVVSMLYKEISKIQRLFGLAGVFLLFIAPFYLAFQAPIALSKLDSVIPAEIFTLPGATITNFWGTGGNWIWMAGSGWFLAFIASLILAIEIAIIPIAIKKDY